MTKQELENYEPKGQLERFPKEIIAKMLDCQEEQGNQRNVSIFEKDRCNIIEMGGFDWYLTKEGHVFWCEVIYNKNFKHFFEKYPKKDNQDYSQEFRVEDKVYDIILGEVGIVKEVNINDISVFQINVVFENHGTLLYTHEGNYLSRRLLHYRDDYNYNVIDFNNLPKRQEPKMWRAEKRGCYYFVSFDERCWFYSSDTIDTYASFDNSNYNSGNYFRTEVEAEIIAQKLNSYFKQLIKEEHEHERN